MRAYPAAGSGAVVVAQRFGDALNLNLPFHALVIDDIYSGASALTPPIFQEAAALTDQDVILVTTLLHRRIMRYLRRFGRLPRDEHDGVAEPEPDELLFAELCAASVQGRVALGQRSGTEVEKLGRRRRDERPLFLPGELCCDVARFSLNAKVRIVADDREGLVRVCTYIARPPITDERLSLAPDGKVIYALRRHWRDGTSAIAFEPRARFPFTSSRAGASSSRAIADVSLRPGTRRPMARQRGTEHEPRRGRREHEMFDPY